MNSSGPICYQRWRVACSPSKTVADCRVLQGNGDKMTACESSE
jgi:hypothetical protein